MAVLRNQLPRKGKVAPSVRNALNARNVVSVLLAKTVVVTVLLVVMTAKIVVLVVVEIANEVTEIGIADQLLVKTVAVIATSVIVPQLRTVTAAVIEIADQLLVKIVVAIAMSVIVGRLPIAVHLRIADLIAIVVVTGTNVVTVAVIAMNAVTGDVTAATASGLLSLRELNGKRLANARRFSLGSQLLAVIRFVLGRQPRMGLA